MLDEEAVETEDLHFLGGLDAGGCLAHIIEFPALGRAAEVEPVALRIEMRLAQEHRHQRHQQQDDQPGREDQETSGEARDGHDVLRLPQQLRHQREAAAGLPARPLELVLKLRILEIFQIEGGGVFHQTDARGVGHALRQEAVDELDDAAQDVGQDSQRELGQDQHAQPVEQAARQPVLESRRPPRHLHQMHHVVDDQLADIEGDDRQQGPHQPQQQRRSGERRTRPPDHRNERPQRAKRAEALLQGADGWTRHPDNPQPGQPAGWSWLTT